MSSQHQSSTKANNIHRFPSLDSLIKPVALKPGDTVACISMSAGLPAIFPQRYQIGVKQLEEVFGLRVIPTKHALRSADWLEKNPEARAEDFMAAFSDSNIKAVISTIGGDDSIRLIPYVDLAVLRSNPKIFMGFSDSTVAHFMCLKAGLASIYGPSIMTSFAENCGMHPHTISGLRQILFSTNKDFPLSPNDHGWTVEHLDWANPENQQQARKFSACTGARYIQGTDNVTGRLIGGCLEVLQFINGTALWPDLEVWDNSILFLETCEDGISATQVAWFLRNLGAQGILSRLSGLLFSKPGGAMLKPESYPEYDTAILKVLEEYQRTDLAVITNLDFGHTEPFFPMAYGSKVRIEPVGQKIVFCESAVC